MSVLLSIAWMIAAFLAIYPPVEWAFRSKSKVAPIMLFLAAATAEFVLLVAILRYAA